MYYKCADNARVTGALLFACSSSDTEIELDGWERFRAAAAESAGGRAAKLPGAGASGVSRRGWAAECPTRIDASGTFDRLVVGSAESPDGHPFLHSRLVPLERNRPLANPFVDTSLLSQRTTWYRRRWAHVFPLGTFPDPST